ncbi:MAG: hypothetical protein AAB577_00480 [Patescibacteria group bacterium]
MLKNKNSNMVYEKDFASLVGEDETEEEEKEEEEKVDETEEVTSDEQEDDFTE